MISYGYAIASIGKVHIFWEGHKILQNLHLTFVCMYCRQMQNSVAFSEYLNFNYIRLGSVCQVQFVGFSLFWFSLNQHSEAQCVA